MNLKLNIIASVLMALALSACSKQESAPASHEKTASEAVVTESGKTTPEQQAAIDALDKPIQDDKNTDIPESVANAPADPVTPHDGAQVSASH